jgi:hypothetical protein
MKTESLAKGKRQGKEDGHGEREAPSREKCAWQEGSAKAKKMVMAKGKRQVERSAPGKREAPRRAEAKLVNVLPRREPTKEKVDKGAK